MLMVVVGTKQIQILLTGTFWIFFFLNIFDLWLEKSKEVEPMDTEG